MLWKEVRVEMVGVIAEIPQDLSRRGSSKERDREKKNLERSALCAKTQPVLLSKSSGSNFSKIG